MTVSNPRPPLPKPVPPDRLVAYSWLKDQIHALRDSPNALADARLLRFSATSRGDDVVWYVREDIVKLQADALRGQTVDFIETGDLNGLRALWGLPREESVPKPLAAAGLRLLIGAVGKLLATGLASKTRPLASLTNAAKGALFLLEAENRGHFDPLPSSVDLAMENPPLGLLGTLAAAGEAKDEEP